ncbi:putative anti-anti-sigma regulatory factor [Streptomyces sp. Tu6071]|uniref:STAS domain-containing protein n=1 Tax=Streptomyces evansiae TaxID=3075535 RepID=A0ABD5E3H9_9ACTN|nr:MULTISPECIES: STAS domain-containing protein [unclassified Streptomyces]ASY32678.1 anti-anti-sigma factor [Streptomyces sp. CLI2509]EGJ74592.1 putative anti-anti-sigma regulatory factor [Streptomyces sp. Tu6071]MDT0415895.1 STAS domain-containing protein [Streptomyces sp. DSM 41982]MYX23993.1 STAS domain-containing protein [Streptomyces sp. SID8380]SCE25762.1 rsbT co-antagonist protein RsbR [Streptomyces sp. SolWspMP-sol7th]
MATAGSVERLAELLAAEQERLTTEWVELALPALQGRVSAPEVGQEIRELYAAVLGALRGGSLDHRAEQYTEVRGLLVELSRNRARQGFTPTETALGVFLFKEILQPELSGSRADLAVFLDFSRLVDGLGLFTVEAHATTREAIITAQAEQLLELSTPVVKVWDGVIAVPLVGTLDSARTQVVMEKLLQALIDHNSTQAIIDITGVSAVDTQVAQHLLKTVVAARLMGAECTISGIRPQIAQTIVGLGIEFGDIVTKSSLADALAHALRRIRADREADQADGSIVPGGLL